MAPITIKIMLACHCSAAPELQLGAEQWNSFAGLEARTWLLESGLIDSDNRSTPKGKAWVQFICSTPLPVATWALPERSHTEFTE